MKADKKLIMHGTPVLGTDGSTTCMRWFPTVTACKKFAISQMKAHGRKAWSMDSLPADVVAEALERYLPIPAHRRRA